MSIPATAAEHLAGDTRIDSNGNLRLPGPSGQAYRGGGPSRITTTKVSTIGSVVGKGAAGVSVALDGFALGRGQMSKTEFGVNFTMTAVGFVNPLGAVASVTFFTGKYFMAPGPHESVVDNY
jgi:hypothetical protein